MRVLRKIIYISLLFLATVLLIAYFLPSSYTVNKSVELNTEQVWAFGLVSKLDQWKHWNSLLQNASIAPPGEDDSTGHTQIRWQGEESMAGTIRILDKQEPAFIRAEIAFDQPAGMVSSEFWTFEKTGNGTLVSVACQGNLRYPIGRLLGSYIRDRVSTQTESSLNQLKELAETENYKP